MLLLDLTLPLPAENLALDEALLDACEAGEITGGVLRLWESDEYFVVLGRSSDPHVEVNQAACQAMKIPVLRRVSGGGTIVAGPGCLMYAVIVERRDRPPRLSIPQAHHFVLNRLAACLGPHVPGIAIAGTSDLAIRRADSLQKFSGNALRMKRTHFLYHGTLLYDFDFERVNQLLAHQTREPPYRAGRQHQEFLKNLPLSRDQLVAALVDGWQATEQLTAWPRERMQGIIREKYIDSSNWVIAQ